MQTLNIFLEKIKLASFGKNIFGNLVAGNFKNIESKDWENEILSFVKSDEVIFTIPNKIVIVQRLKVSSEIIKTALEKTILKRIQEKTGIVPEELIFSYERKGSEVLFFAVGKEELQDFFNKLKSKKIKSIIVIPKIFADFEVFKKGIAEDETTVYVEKEGSAIHFSFFDHFGPAAYFKKIGDLESTVEKTISDFENNENKKVKRIILGGSEVLSINLDYFSKKVGIWTTKAEKILEERIFERKLKINVRDESPVLFLTNFGAYFYILENQKINLFKNGQAEEKKEQVEELKMKTAPVIVKEFNQPSAKKVNKKFSFVIFTILILIAIIFFSWKFLGNRFESKDEVSNDQLEEIPTSTPTASNAATPTPKLEKSDLKIQVLNGSGQKGAASSLKKLLIENSYDNDIKTGNADNFKYTETVIEIKNEKKDYLTLLLDDLKNEYNISSDSAVLDESNDFDVVIIIGKS